MKADSTPWQLLCPLSLSLASLLFALLPGSFSTALQYHRIGLADGDWWRILTAHLTHLGWGHLSMNLCGLWLIWYLFPAIQPALRCLILLLFLMLGTALGLWLFSPEVIWYRGLSGILHGLLVWALLEQLRKAQVISLIILPLVILKLIWEQWQGPLAGSESLAAGSVIVDAHLYGAVSGVILWGITELRPASLSKESE
ncbi:MAG: rhombosortase [gamma proteobacterium symbiont of Ctena orbiculata]|uniref:Rhombosortase n=1 Tax=Candidatus Thiodiazotropha taylori TaxID=2792791 RepID=A0A944M8K5_9GAMM|nr:rhombosortase [Candidatus Thiodiazotropha taylori]PUB87261.1 MAG: rhombosortase [gamma proteobacterium symbiont of Ctena orbiculata]MBT2989279.1 rhombosortase [Candidatus Thiodiazotropha taylori]MBT2995512.1 rhombosortase [Candidatus Thiodiazotropha taylori]MBT2999534.1 rhombosortase [Candidatus Thiodiazotropha taylori]